MDLSLQCDAEWKAMEPSMTLLERKVSLLETIFRVIAFGLIGDGSVKVQPDVR